MIELKLNIPLEVNKKQYDLATEKYGDLLARRIDDNGKLWIKPLIWMGMKNEMERSLTRLKNK